jgi:predicted O-linked N-acetylglucosamine transferase (SPINDLY family)
MNEINILFNKAFKLHQSNDIENAKILYENILTTDPAHFDSTHLLGVVFYQEHQFEEAIYWIRKAIDLKNDDAAAYNNLANALVKISSYEEAIENYNQAIRLKADYKEAYFNRGVAQKNQALIEESIESFNRSISFEYNLLQSYTNQGKLYFSLHDYQKSLTCFLNALKINSSSDLYLQVGLIYFSLSQFRDSVNSFSKCLALDPINSEALFHQANSLQKLAEFSEAINCYTEAIKLNSQNTSVFVNRGIAFNALKNYDHALKDFDKALELNPNLSTVFCNKGVTYNELRNYELAIFNFNNAIGLDQEFSEAYLNRGNSFYGLKSLDHAIDNYNIAIKLNNKYALAYSNKANALQELRRFKEAAENFKIAYSLNAHIEFAYGKYINSKLMICDWDSFNEDTDKLRKYSTTKQLITPFDALSILDDPEFHKNNTENYIKHKFKDFNTPIIKINDNHQKIKLAYFSADFKEHPVSYLTAEIFELHDREKFEVFGFSLTKVKNSQLRNRIIDSFDHHLEVWDLSDLEVAKLSHHLEIDIAIDLGGHTVDSRVGIFANRAAPIQISYIGYLGTMGAKFIDYIVADHIIIPFNQNKYYTEKIIYLPSYQSNDSKRILPTKILGKQYVIPKNSFVYCNFNNNYKLLPDIFECWMQILFKVDNSILFLFADNEDVIVNLKKYAELSGVNGNRLIFSNRTSYEEYLSRYSLCNLFLDTSPYNAGTTASDSLWCNVPVLTIAGNSFASRVAASLLTSIGLSDLITAHKNDYVNLAVELAHNQKKYAEIQSRLNINKSASPLFNSQLFTKNWEWALRLAYECLIQNEEVDHIDLMSETRD